MQKNSEFSPEELKPARVINGIALFGYATILEAIWGENWWKHGTVEGEKKINLWCKSFGVMKYAETGDKFSLENCIIEAQSKGYKFVLLQAK